MTFCSLADHSSSPAYMTLDGRTGISTSPTKSRSALAKEHTEHLRVRVTGVLQRLDIWMCIYPEHSDVPTVSLVEIRDWGQIDETVASDCKDAIRCVLFDRGPR